MNAKTKEAIQRHGESLLLAFPNATEKNPMALCKKLRRIETVAHKGAEAYCNGDTFHIGIAKKFDFNRDENAWESFEQFILTKVEKLLSDCDEILVNGDARGYALKLTEEFTTDWNNAPFGNHAGRLKIYSDMGGYGILAPDLNQ